MSVESNKDIIELLNIHKESFDKSLKFAKATGQPTPQDTAKWSQIFVSLLFDIKGLYRKKGADLSDGSDVKGACIWDAIDTPRFNGVVPAGRILKKYSSSKDIYNKIFFVMWDHNMEKKERCRVWAVNLKKDKIFNKMVDKWYKQRQQGIIKSSNFQLHPPRNKDSNVFTNRCGNLVYPLVFEAIFESNTYRITQKNLNLIDTQSCKEFKT